ncbi:MAG: RDD family protein [Symploca sp. SIO1A3]|nr:RDD family protein [Symploca sp. SIO1A3]
MNYADFWQRFLAFMIDSIIVQVCAAVVIIIVVEAYKAVGGSIEVIAILLFLISLIGSWLYYATMESSPRQATLGKIVMEIYVTDLYGNRITFDRATSRYFAKILSRLIFSIGYIMAAFTDRKQALHDIIAGTLVLKG